MKKLKVFFSLFLCVFFVPIFLSIPGFSQEPYTFVLKWGGSGSGNGEFNFHCSGYNGNYLGRLGGIAVDSKNYVYVVDTYNWRVQKFDKNGNYILQWGTYGTEDGQFIFPMGVGIDKNDNVYVSDGGLYVNTVSRVQKFTSEGTFLGKWEGSLDTPYPFSCPGGIDFDTEGNIFLVALANPPIRKYDSYWNYLGGVGYCGSPTNDSDPYSFVYPSYIGVNSKGEFFISVWGEYYPPRAHLYIIVR